MQFISCGLKIDNERRLIFLETISKWFFRLRLIAMENAFRGLYKSTTITSSTNGFVVIFRYVQQGNKIKSIPTSHHITSHISPHVKFDLECNEETHSFDSFLTLRFFFHSVLVSVNRLNSYGFWGMGCHLNRTCFCGWQALIAKIRTCRKKKINWFGKSVIFPFNI